MRIAYGAFSYQFWMNFGKTLTHVNRSFSHITLYLKHSE